MKNVIAFLLAVSLSAFSMCSLGQSSNTKEILRLHGYYSSYGDFMANCGPLKFATKENIDKFDFPSHEASVCYAVLSRAIWDRLSISGKNNRCDLSPDYLIGTSDIDRGKWTLLVIADFVREFSETKPDYSFPSSVAQAGVEFSLFLHARFQCPFIRD